MKEKKMEYDKLMKTIRTFKAEEKELENIIQGEKHYFALVYGN